MTDSARRAALFLLLLSAPVVLGQPGPSAGRPANPNDKMQVRSIRPGFFAGAHSGATGDDISSATGPVSKAGAWTPVFIDLLCVGKYDGQAEIIISSADCDEVNNTYTVQVPNLDIAQSALVTAYVRPGSRNGELTATIRAVSQGRAKLLCAPVTVNTNGLEPSQIVYLTLGSRLPNLQLPTSKDDSNTTNIDARCLSAALSDVPHLPTQWFAYSSADLAFLVTSDRDFMTGLVSEREGRKLALAEWVRRGGRLVVCSGRNQDLLAGCPELTALLPGTIGGSYSIDKLSLIWTGGVSTPDLPGKLEAVKIAPRPDAATLIEGPDKSSPLVCQASYGLGCVTFVAFDLDLKPFAGSKVQSDFWKNLLATTGPRLGAAQNNNNRFGRYGNNPEDAQLESVIKQLENFPGVPVISFGWVALFILLYIIVVGPLDYLFLKYVVKRLELTWITFPTVVVVVSAVAYFTAYALKGSDLRVNKLDLLEIDVRGQQAFGRSMFTVFSPRIQNYTVGVGTAGFLPATSADNPSGLMVSWLGEVRAGRQSLFRRDYRYEPGGAGVVDVPIQVWSTKGFEASWTSRLDPAALPIASELTQSPTEIDKVFGSVTNNFPVKLENAALILPARTGEPMVYELGTIAAGENRIVTVPNPMTLTNWMGRTGREFSFPVQSLFSDLYAGGNTQSNNGNAPTNASLRPLDQSWRLRPGHTGEAILIGYFPIQKGRAEDMTAQPQTTSPLWLGELPSSGKPRPPLNGTLRQDTLVRVYLPVAAAKQ